MALTSSLLVDSTPAQAVAAEVSSAIICGNEQSPCVYVFMLILLLVLLRVLLLIIMFTPILLIRLLY